MNTLRISSTRGITLLAAAALAACGGDDASTTAATVAASVTTAPPTASAPSTTSAAVPDEDPGHIQRIDKERSEVAHRDQLRRETQPHVIAPPLRHQHPIGAIKKEEPIQIVLHRRTPIPAENRRLLITQELDRHEQPRYDAREGRRSARHDGQPKGPYRWILFHCSPNPWLAGAAESFRLDPATGTVVQTIDTRAGPTGSISTDGTSVCARNVDAVVTEFDGMSGEVLRNDVADGTKFRGPGTLRLYGRYARDSVSRTLAWRD